MFSYTSFPDPGRKRTRDAAIALERDPLSELYNRCTTKAVNCKYIEKTVNRYWPIIKLIKISERKGQCPVDTVSQVSIWHSIVIFRNFDVYYFHRNLWKYALKMVKIALQIKATLECIDKLYTNHPHYQWFLKLRCSYCGETSGKFHDLTEADKVPQKHNRSETHLLIKCKLCSRENSMDIIEGSNGMFLYFLTSCVLPDVFVNMN